MLFAEAEVWAEPVAGSELLNEIVVLLERYVDAPLSVYRAAALWALFTHALSVSSPCRYRSSSRRRSAVVRQRFCKSWALSWLDHFSLHQSALPVCSERLKNSS